jgi:hypothetical protein
VAEREHESSKVGQKFKEESERIGFVFILLCSGGRNEKDMCKIIKIRGSVILRQKTLANIRVKTSLVDYCTVKVDVCMEGYVVQCNRNEWSGLVFCRCEFGN